MFFLKTFLKSLVSFFQSLFFQKRKISIADLPSREVLASERAFSHGEAEVGGQALSLPTHLALIMDGNGRYAVSQGQKRSYGHLLGAENFLKILCYISDLGIPYATFYAFSTENWKRPQEEVERLLSLFAEYCSNYRELFKERQIRVRFLGNKSVLSPQLQALFEETEALTKEHQGLQAILAINYSGRQDIVEACKWCMRASKEGFFTEEQIEKFAEENFRQAMYLPDVPDPDLLIRTAGEYRLSNFMLWNLAYTEFYVSPKCWPVFDREDLDLALVEFQKRDRRFGKIKEN